MSFLSVDVLVAAELGSPWPAWLGQLLHGSTRRVLSQAETESSAAFAERLAGATAAELGRTLGTLVLLCNERSDLVQQAARGLLLEPLLGTLGRQQRQRIVVAARGETPEIRQALEALAAKTPTSALCSVELRLEAPRPTLPTADSDLRWPTSRSDAKENRTGTRSARRFSVVASDASDWGSRGI